MLTQPALQSQPRTSVADLLARIGAEVLQAADHVGDIQVPAPIGDAGLVELQKLDLVEQTLRSLAAVLRAIAAAEVAAVPLDLSPLIGALPLSGLATRLQGATPDPADDAVELF